MQPERGDVVRSSDPFKIGTGRQRPWLIVDNETHPFDGEQYIAVAISTKAYDDSLALSADVWETGGVPRAPYVSPWAVHSPRSEDFVAWQGRVTDAFVEQVVAKLETYLRGDRMSPRTLTAGLIPRRRAASTGKPSCRAVRLSGADVPKYAGVSRPVAVAHPGSPCCHRSRSGNTRPGT
ncbi:hypothetical protein [Haloferax sulfurifontis]|uniref:hypothetical protein n=1 Tax=Haloferax sulfurifontis TaxID=255616 RepID=UPI001EF9DB25|nr:hypothetical protein [Haloferax sulfurifontis]